MSPPKIVAFAYVGKTAAKQFDGITDDVSTLDTRLDAVEKQLGLSDTTKGNNQSLTEKVAEIEKTISAYTSENTISSAITT